MMETKDSKEEKNQAESKRERRSVKQLVRYELESYEREQQQKLLRTYSRRTTTPCVPPKNNDSDGEGDDIRSGPNVRWVIKLSLDEDRMPIGVIHDIMDESEVHLDDGIEIQEQNTEQKDKKRKKKKKTNKKQKVPPRAWDPQLKNIVNVDFKIKIGPTTLPPQPQPIFFYFDQLIPPTAWELFVLETNRYVKQKNNNITKKWKYVTVREIKAYFGVLMLMGIITMPKISDYWSKKMGLSQIINCFSRNRWKEINSCFHLNNNENYIGYGHDGYDRLFKIRPFLNIIEQTFRESYIPSRNLSVDEAMIAYTGRCYFKQYLPAKPIKRGLKCWCINDSLNGYLLGFDLYTGAAGGSEKGLGYRVVRQLSKPYENSNRIIFCDRYFTSVPLFEDLFAVGLGATGTVMSNRKDFDKSLVEWGHMGERIQGDYKSSQSGCLVGTVWMDKKPVFLLSTASCGTKEGKIGRSLSGTKDKVDVKCPQALIDYNHGFGGTDDGDQHYSYYPMGRRSLKWWKYAFLYFMNMSVINSMILFNHIQTNRGQKTLTQLEYRLTLSNHLIAQWARIFEEKELPIKTSHSYIQTKGRQVECVVCSDRKHGRRVRTSYSCLKCEVALCSNECYQEFHKTDSSSDAS